MRRVLILNIVCVTKINILFDRIYYSESRETRDIIKFRIIEKKRKKHFFFQFYTVSKFL